MTEPTLPPPLVLYVDDERANRIVFEQSLSELNVRDDERRRERAGAAR